MELRVRIQEEDFDMGTEYRRLRTAVAASGAVGAVATFTGLVRELYSPEATDSERVDELLVECYPAMTVRRLEDIAAAAGRRWSLAGVHILHRFGRLGPGEQIVFVGTAAAHRQGAMAGACYVMDYLKTQAPFWKKQTSQRGSHWIGARASDAAAVAAWQGRGE